MEELNGLTPAEFAAKVKEKYPQYKDVEDSILVEKMVEKYPQYKDKINYGEVSADTEVVEPKKEKTEVKESGELDSTSVEKGSLSESNQTDSFNLVFKMQHPELVSEVQGLQDIIKSRPIMSDNSKELKRIVSSTRFKNSGLKLSFSASSTRVAFAVTDAAPSTVMSYDSPRCTCAKSWAALPCGRSPRAVSRRCSSCSRISFMMDPCL